MSVSTPANANYSSMNGGSYYVGPDSPPPIPSQDPQGDATIVCDGVGGYEPQLNGFSDAPCGMDACVTEHEQSHANDWSARYPDGCDGQPEGGDIPLGGAGYDDFLRDSECDAYTREEACLNGLRQDASPECEEVIDDEIDLVKQRQGEYCGDY